MDTQPEVDAYAGLDDDPETARLRHLLVRKFATTMAFDGQPVTEYPHLAADAALRIVRPLLAGVAAQARETVRKVKADVGDAAEETVIRRLNVIEAAARASERAACVAQLRAEGATLAAVALEMSGPDAAVVARDAVSLKAAAGSLASHPVTAQ